MTNDNTITTPRKGDQLWLVSESSDSRRPGQWLVCAQFVTITSWGKQQGTAEYSDGSRNLRQRLYTNSIGGGRQYRLMASLVEVKAYAATRFDKSQETIDHFRKHFSNRPSIMAQLTETPVVRLWAFDGHEEVNKIYRQAEAV